MGSESRHASLIRQLQGMLGGKRFAAATVSAAGALVSGFGIASAARTPAGGATGDYTLTFDPGFDAMPQFAFGIGDTAATYSAKLHASGPNTGSSIRVATFNTNSGAAVDGVWSIICIG